MAQQPNTKAFSIANHMYAFRLGIMQCLIVFLLAACERPFIAHYQRFANVSQGNRSVAGSTAVKIIETGELEAQVSELKFQGYELLGASCFIDVDTGNRLDGIRQLAKKEDAEIVVTWQAPMNAAILDIQPSIKPRKDWRGNNPVRVQIPMKMYCAFPMSRRSASAPAE